MRMTLTTSVPYSGTIPSILLQKTRLTKELRTTGKAIRTIVTTHLDGFLDEIRSDPEMFYQNHVTAIFMGIYLETAMGPLLGALGIYLFNHWMR